MKWLIGIAKLAVSAAITSLCCVALTFAAANTYVDLLLDQYHIPRPAGQKIEWSAFMSRFTAQLGLGTGGGVPAKPKDLAVSVPPASNTPSSSETGMKERTQTDGKTTAPGSGKANDDPYRVPEDAVAVWSRQSGKASNKQDSLAEQERKVVVSSEEVTKKKEQLSEADKAKIFSLMVSRVPQEDMQTISKLMEDGITAGELKEIERLLQKSLKPDEYKQLIGLIQKETP
ncbi:hypothetical protein NLX71_18185 [Paenibacillus sp. MZ04-78.2]|uniref:hypothetical protein n=1 Tax=Paenibacillus sp. MZ04-78.2 TaxID=2962034 RepID=UPI0020B71502|nr:hypothetical protein [Paenibacillus sp. MZ04-78.2]MCP3775203.1 hypothetical protein [Paenibacillus sp. MZ04-78.2]